jgi:hypothetical protein
MDLAEELRESLHGVLASGAIEIREAGGRTSPLPPLSWEVRGAPDKPLLHLWAENCNVTRRVLAITGQSQERILLAVERFGRATPARMEIVRLNFQRSAKQISREDFCEQLRRVLAENFPDEALEKLSIASDLEHSLSGLYARGIFRRGAIRGAFLAVPQQATQDAIESSLTFALLWLERARQSSGKGLMSFLRLILPQGKASLLTHQLAALDSRMAVQVYELNSLHEHIERADPLSDGNVSGWLVPRRECDLLLDHAHADLAPIISLAPDAITPHAVPHEQEVVLRFHGLPFARWCDGQIHYWSGSAWRALSPRNQQEMQRMVQKLKAFRHPLASDSRHPLYRAYPERWMQTLIKQDLSRIDIQLDPDHVYDQVIAQSGSHHGILDLLAVTRNKRLAILELKATENPELPLQAADYWNRIRRHLSLGDLSRYGYFAGMELQSAAPLVYLIAPALRFHPTTDALLKYLSPDMEIIRIGLAESWRRGFRVVMRQ